MAAVLTAGDRGYDFDDGDAGDLEVMGRLGPNQGENPGAPDLDHMALDQGGRVEEIIRHR
jgi:hypothetical protein